LACGATLKDWLLPSCVLALSMFAGASARAAECTGAYVAAEDRFTAPLNSAETSARWYDFGTKVRIGGGKLTMQLTPNLSGGYAEYQALRLRATDPAPIEICAGIRIKAHGFDEVEAGLMFWSVEDANRTVNAYLWAILNSGYFKLARATHGSWQDVHLARSSLVHSGADAFNTLGVSWDDKQGRVRFLINGVIAYETTDLRAPEAETRAGVASYLLPPATGPASVEVTDFKITMPVDPKR
jgi:hypothetical protein